MDKKHTEIAITGVLILVLAFVSVNSIKAFKKRTPSTGQAKPVAAYTQERAYPKENYEKAPDEKLRWTRDPFSGRTYSSTEGAGDLRLDGIIWEKKEPLAMINDSIVKIGDEITGNKIIDIKADRVILSDGKRDFELKLEE